MASLAESASARFSERLQQQNKVKVKLKETPELAFMWICASTYIIERPGLRKQNKTKQLYLCLVVQGFS